MTRSSFKHPLKRYALTLASLGLVGLMLFGSVQVASASSSFTYNVSSSQVLSADGTVVYTGTSFTIALDWAVSHPNTITYIPAGHYNITGEVDISGGVTIYGDGPAKTVLTGIKGAFTPMMIYNASNVNINNIGISGHLNIDCYVETGSRQSNIDIHDVIADNITSDQYSGAFYVYLGDNARLDGITFTRCNVTNSNTFGFCIDGSGPSKGSLVNDLVFDSCTAYRCGLAGGFAWNVGFDICEATNVQNVELTNCYASYCWESGFYLENTPSETGVSFINCVSSHNGQKTSDVNNGDGTFGPQFGMGFLFDPAKIPSISFSGCSGVGNARGLSPLSPRATTLSTSGTSKDISNDSSMNAIAFVVVVALVAVVLTALFFIRKKKNPPIIQKNFQHKAEQVPAPVEKKK